VPASQPKVCHNCSHVKFQSISQMSGKQGRCHHVLLSATLPAPTQDLPAQERRVVPSSQAASLPSPTAQYQALGLVVVISASVIPQCKTTCSSESLDNPAPPGRFLPSGFTKSDLSGSHCLQQAAWMHAAPRTSWLHASLPCQYQMALWYLTSLSFLRPLYFFKCLLYLYNKYSFSSFS